MDDIEKKAIEYAKLQISGMDFANNYERTCELDNYRCAFLAGAAYALGNQWRDIPTDKDGLGDASAIDTYITLPIIVRYQDGYIFAVNYDWGEYAEWYNDILNHPDRYKWLPIPEYEPKGE